MNREFVEMPEFIKAWERLGLTDEDLFQLEEYLSQKPERGAVMKGTGGLRKLRWDLNDSGKSDGIRTLYVDFAFYEKIYFLTVYPKNEKDNLTKEQKNSVKRVIKIIGDELERKRKK